MSRDLLPSSLPVFPLNTVLFPGMPLSLRIFEERYKEMLIDLPAVGNRFVVALIKSGLEVGGSAEPHEVGCVAEVMHTQPMPGDAFLVHATGRARVRIERLDRVSRPYLTASVSEWPEVEEPIDHEIVAVVRVRFEEYARVLASLAEHEPPAFRAPAEPEALSWLVATVVQIPDERRQQLLEHRAQLSGWPRRRGYSELNCRLSARSCWLHDHRIPARTSSRPTRGRAAPSAMMGA